MNFSPATTTTAATAPTPARAETRCAVFVVVGRRAVRFVQLLQMFTGDGGELAVRGEDVLYHGRVKFSVKVLGVSEAPW